MLLFLIPRPGDFHYPWALASVPFHLPYNKRSLTLPYMLYIFIGDSVYRTRLLQTVPYAVPSLLSLPRFSIPPSMLLPPPPTSFFFPAGEFTSTCAEAGSRFFIWVYYLIKN